jgi:hypothetical protein
MDIDELQRIDWSTRFFLRMCVGPAYGAAIKALE